MFLRRSPPRRTYATLGFKGSRHAANNKHQVVVGLRQEDPLRIWERRTPLTPEMVYELVREEGVRVLVQPCERRVFPLEEYIRAGAEPHFTLDPANIIVGIKEPPIYSLHALPPGVSHDSPPSPSPSSPLTAVDLDLGVHGKPRTYMMFSHTVKGQPYNMPLLSRFLGPKDSARLIDYELLTEDGVRSVGFGWFAGVAGALESMAAMGQTHLGLGAASPFLQTPRPHTHRSIESLRQALRLVGADISARGTPRSLGPCIFAVTGSGKVSQGVLSILEELPLQKITAQELEGLVMDPNADLYKVYLCHVQPSDYLVSKSGKPYSREDYYAHPDSYESHFHTKIAPYTTLLLNGTGWNPGFPRLMTNEQLAITLTRAREIGPGRFASVGDISCDVEGGLEFLTHATTLSSPTFIARPPGTPTHLPGVQVMAVDILPATLPLDASEHFSRALRPYLHALVRDYKGVNGIASARKEDEKYLASLERATIAKEGQLVEPHGWLAAVIEKVCGGLGGGVLKETPNTGDAMPSSSTATTTTHTSPLNTILHKKRVLLLGSGMVAGPAVKELCRHADVNLVVASNVLHEANALASRYVNAKAVQLELPASSSLSPAAAGSGGAGNGNLEQLVEQADLVISLLPVPFHPRVARVCLDHGKHLVTASYISPAMRDLHAEALQKDVLLMNEIGLDPGIDHVSATALLTQIRDAKRRVVSFTSFCGGLPAPDSLAGDGTGLGYKFSWSPRGVLGAALNGARFKLAGKDWDILGKDILKSHFPRVPIGGQGQALNLEGIANRDSLSYAGPYELGRVENLRTLLRGTLRYAGFSRLMHSFKQVGLLGTELPVDVPSWNDLARISLEQKIGRPIPKDSASFLSALSDVVPAAEDQDALVEALDWLGLSPSSKQGLAVKPTANLPPIDLFTQVLANKLRYAPNERDLVVLSHEIVSRGKEHGVHEEEEVHTSSLITYGDAEASAMARTVGLPVAFAALRILSGQITMRGVRGPSEERVMWAGVLTDLEEAGLKMEEKTTRRGIEGLLASGLEERVRSA